MKQPSFAAIKCIVWLRMWDEMELRTEPEECQPGWKKKSYGIGNECLRSRRKNQKREALVNTREE